MPRKYLAFLGTNKYEECYYVFKDSDRIRCRFVQEALTQILCANWTPADRILIFTTAEAKQKNWDSSADWVGLNERFQALPLPCPFQQIDIPDGDSEDALWKIFESVFGQLQDGDEIVFDITHAFRSLPMLAIIILNYARFVKQCSLSGIYYGAFEAIGSNARSLPIEQRNAPVFDLTPFVSVLDWTVGIDRFLNTGDASAISALTRENIQPLLTASRGQNHHAQTLRYMAQSLENFAQNSATCRGKDLSSSALLVRRNIEQAIQASRQIAMPLQPLLEKMQRRFQPYREDRRLLNLFEIVKWCQEHQLIQQGLTILEESILTELCRQLEGDPDDIEFRHAISAGIAAIARKSPEYDAEFHAKYRDRLNLEQLRPLLPSKNFVNAFERLRRARNDINHSGCLKHPKKAHEFAKILATVAEQFERDWLAAALPDYEATAVHGTTTQANADIGDMRVLFLLFSHTLTDEQAADARAALGVTSCVALPDDLQAIWSDIPPDLETLDAHLQPIFEWLAMHAQPGDYVLAQGDFGAVYLSVTWALAHQLIPVYATTARRAVEIRLPDGKVQTQRTFQHVRFRNYHINNSQLTIHN